MAEEGANDKFVIEWIARCRAGLSVSVSSNQVY